MKILLLHLLLSVSIVENLGNDIVRDHDHLNCKFRVMLTINVTSKLRIHSYQYMHSNLLIMIITYLQLN